METKMYSKFRKLIHISKILLIYIRILIIYVSIKSKCNSNLNMVENS